MKGLRLEIYTPSYGNCSNNGVSARCKGVTLIHPKLEGTSEPNEDYPAVYIKAGFRGYLYVASDETFSDKIGPMAGGCLVWSSDSRVREVMPYPLSLHDRYETQEEYDTLSR